MDSLQVMLDKQHEDMLDMKYMICLTHRELEMISHNLVNGELRAKLMEAHQV